MRSPGLAPPSPAEEERELERAAHDFMAPSASGPSRWPRPCTRVYLAMLGLSLVTFAIGETGASGIEVSLLVLLFALVKGQMLGDFFMGLKGVRGLWRWVIFLWLFVPGTLIAVAFALAT